MTRRPLPAIDDSKAEANEAWQRLVAGIMLTLLALFAIGVCAVIYLLAHPTPAHSATASWYGPGFAGRLTANGERFNPRAATCAHRTFPFGTKLRLRHAGKTTVCRVNDRGPAAWTGRDIDLSLAVFSRLADPDLGLIRVKMEKMP